MGCRGAAARAELEAKDLGGLVDALLADAEPEAAWLVTEVNPDWDPGERRWKRLAKTREESHPAQAMAVYLRLADIKSSTRVALTTNGLFHCSARHSVRPMRPVGSELSRTTFSRCESGSANDRHSSKSSIGPNSADS